MSRFFTTTLLSCLVVANGLVAEVDIALYDDRAQSEGGAWEPTLLAIQDLALERGYTVELIGPNTVNNGPLAGEYRMIIFPGGWTGGYNRYINSNGYQRIRDFISGGGAYMGMCAGAFFASSEVYWRPNYTTEQEVYDYPLDLWEGIADGVILDFKQWTSPTCIEFGREPFFGARMVDLEINTTLIPESDGLVPVMYYGGPFFRPPGGKWGRTEVVARYSMPGDSGDAYAAMILFPYGSGRVFLSGLHPELSLNEETCELYYEPEARGLLGGIMDRLLQPATPILAGVSLGKRIHFATLQGFRYQLQSSADGLVWSDYGEIIEAESFESIVAIPEESSGLEFRLILVPEGS